MKLVGCVDPITWIAGKLSVPCSHQLRKNDHKVIATRELKSRSRSRISYALIILTSEHPSSTCSMHTAQKESEYKPRRHHPDVSPLRAGTDCPSGIHVYAHSTMLNQYAKNGTVYANILHDKNSCTANQPCTCSVKFGLRSFYLAATCIDIT